ncbi:hypothetical protein MB901379_00488 [Mycobacterium basiliense]|uniref:Uncharacterized protein n=1 Tax=Mycobacterium basiliense TaxID=2094119 RepID=A0A3S4BSU9_9MYCO|nr:hypothetical protein [Mycobacterium basiliense]VDM86959.1 hypothetical protein MB901379_00488 [Mycobacterium basiliense]
MTNDAANPEPAAETPTQATARHLAHSGVVGLIDRSSRVEHLQQRRDIDRARWLGVACFRRPPTPAEEAVITPHCQQPQRVSTYVDVSGHGAARWRRRWPELAANTDTARYAFAQAPAGRSRKPIDQ